MSAQTTQDTLQSLRPLGRIAGVLYLIIIVGGIYAGAVRPMLTVADDPAATAAAITASEGLFRSTILADLAMIMADVAIGAAFYYLLCPVNAGLSLLTALFRLAQAAALGLNLLMLFLALNLITGDVYIPALGSESAEALAYLFLTAHGIGYSLALVFFAFSILIQGYLFIGSGYFPRWLGVLLIAASVTYFADSLALFALPNYAAVAPVLATVLVAVALPVELTVSVWLLVRGVRTDALQPTRNTTSVEAVAG
jgi:hypothetical protein